MRVPERDGGQVQRRRVEGASFGVARDLQDGEVEGMVFGDELGDIERLGASPVGDPRSGRRRRRA